MNQADNLTYKHIPKIFVICDQRDTAPVWGYILHQKGLMVILETSAVKALEHWSVEPSDLLVIDLDIPHPERMQLYMKFRAVSVIPILFILPAYHETQVLEAYQAGVDEVAIKPISPPIFLAKIMAWVRRSWSMPIDGLNHVHAGQHRLDPMRRCLVDQAGVEIKLTNLEFRLLHLLMRMPGQVFSTEEILQATWKGYSGGDDVLLKNVVYRLRKKIEKDPAHPALIRTWGGGYSFEG